MKLLENKNALVTGGSRGIGRAIVEKFAQNGANVAFTYRSSATEAEALIDELSDLGVELYAFQSDASSYSESEELFKKFSEKFDKIDILVNNAGITKDNLMLRMKEEDWDSVIQTNLKSVFNLTKQVLRPMMKQRLGSIINMSSIVGRMGQAGQANYAASKAGIIGFSKSIAKEMGSRNVRCNTIAPGFIETDMTATLDESILAKYNASIPLNRLGKGEDIANLAVFLASDQSNYITGQCINVCGGLNC